MKTVIIATILLALTSIESQAQEDIDWMFATLTTAAGATECSVFVLPDGQGTPFTAAFTAGYEVIDATITILLTDYNLVPIVGYPAEDLWLETANDGMVACASGTIADGPTDASGEAIWAQSPLAGGNSGGETMHGVVSGWRLAAPLPITVNSADLNGDLVVDLTDIVMFASALFGSYNYAADFNFDGVVNLVDIVHFVPSIGTNCP